MTESRNKTQCCSFCTCGPLAHDRRAAAPSWRRCRFCEPQARPPPALYKLVAPSAHRRIIHTHQQLSHKPPDPAQLPAARWRACSAPSRLPMAPLAPWCAARPVPAPGAAAACAPPRGCPAPCSLGGPSAAASSVGRLRSSRRHIPAARCLPPPPVACWHSRCRRAAAAGAEPRAPCCSRTAPCQAA